MKNIYFIIDLIELLTHKLLDLKKLTLQHDY